MLRKQIRHRDGRVRLDPPEIVEEVARLARAQRPRPRLPAAPDRPARAALAQLLDAQRAAADARRAHARAPASIPTTPSALGIDDGERCRITSAHGAIEIEATLTDEVKPGTVAVPHGWGHSGGWQVANAAGGANVNVLASSDPADLERLAGMAHLNGIPIRVEPVAIATASETERAVPAGA